MKRQLLKAAGLAVVVLGLSHAIALAQATEEKLSPEMEQRLQELMERTTRDLNGRIEASGMVVDEQERRLDGVRMSVTRTVVDPERPSFTRDEREEVLVDGWFEAACEPCSSMHLRFFKQGHYGEGLDLYVADAPSPVVAEESRVLSRGHQQVVLRGVGRLARLGHFSGHVQLSAVGIHKVLPLRRGWGRSTVRLERVSERTKAALLDEEPLLYLTGEVNADDTLAAMPGREPSSAHHRVPQEGVALHFARPGNGLVLHDASGEGNPQRVFRGMRTAPEEGYQQTLELDPDHEGPYYFFCRVGDRYGKGRVMPPAFAWDDKQVVSAFCEVYLNVEPGDRNLESY